MYSKIDTPKYESKDLEYGAEKIAEDEVVVPLRTQDKVDRLKMTK